eukprot:TRINITY_DN2062_c0_g1_i1.p1 TRINITY_DN2062_c0_g1~~TRINITY_DN2062_c0_g1_i1.p1  ORF type:complete len:136 (+),score=45.22 TRINITY_DN2062_c0_g1_i1:479-886(+)
MGRSLKAGSTTKGEKPSQLQMKKKKSSSSAKKTQQVPTTAKGPKNDIDDIFSSVKKTKGTKEKKLTYKERQAKIEEREKKKELRQKDDDFWGDSRGNNSSSRYTEEGYPIFTKEQLKIGEGGDTDLCPFDCKCCF